MYATNKSVGGIVGCPADAIESVIKIANFVSTKNGGNGAVREYIDWFVTYFKKSGNG